MLAKMLSALLSAITLSAIYTFNQKSTLESYSVEYVFLMGSVTLLAFYVIIGIPLSLLADRIYRRKKTTRYMEIVWRVAIYFLFGIGFSLLFLIFRQLTVTSNSIKLMIQFGISGVVFAVYQILIEYINLLIRKNN